MKTRNTKFNEVISQEIIRQNNHQKTSNELWVIYILPDHKWYSQAKIKDKLFCLMYNNQITDYLVNNFKMRHFNKEVTKVDDKIIIYFTK